MTYGSSRSPYAPALPGAIVHGLSIGPLALLLVWYWASEGVVRNLDWHVHLCWIGGYAEALASGLVYPRWIDTPNGGLGAPIFLLYPPLSHFLGGLVALLSDATLGLKLVVSLGTVLQFFGARSWFRRQASSSVASVLASAFCLAPQAIAPGYWFNMPATALGLAAAAWVFALMDPRGKATARSLIALAVAGGALLLSHLPTALTTGPALGALLVAGSIAHRGDALRRLVALALGGVLALPYLLAAWLSMDHLHADYLHEGALWQIEYNLLPLLDDSPMRALGANTAWFWAAGLLSVLIAVASAVVLHRRRRLDAAAWLLLIAAMLVSVLTFDIAAPLYDQFAVLRWLQFGWRWQGVGLLLALGLLARALAGDAGSMIGRQLAATGVLLALLGLSVIGPELRSPFWLASRTSGGEANAAGVSCFWDTLEHRPRSMGEAWNITSRQLPQSPTVLDGRVHVIGRQHGPHRRSYFLHVDFPSRVRLDALAFPGWTTLLNGRPTKTSIGKFGLIELDLPAGQHTLVVQYRPPFAVRLIESVSLALLVVLMLMALRERR